MSSQGSLAVKGSQRSDNRGGIRDMHVGKTELPRPAARTAGGHAPPDAGSLQMLQTRVSSRDAAPPTLRFGPVTPITGF